MKGLKRHHCDLDSYWIIQRTLEGHRSNSQLNEIDMPPDLVQEARTPTWGQDWLVFALVFSGSSFSVDLIHAGTGRNMTWNFTMGRYGFGEDSVFRLSSRYDLTCAAFFERVDG